MATSRISAPRASKNNSISEKRFTQFLSFAESVQEYNAGSVTNAVVQKIEDAFAGNNKYFTLRPSISFAKAVASFTGCYGVSNNTQYSVFGTKDNLYIGNYNGVTAYIPSGAALTTYQTWANTTLGDYPFISNWQNTSNGNLYTVATKTGDPTAYICYNNYAGPTYVAQALGFNAVAHCVSLDGYLFIAGQNTDAIYNCALNNTASWNLSVNYIRASQRPGVIRALARLKTFVVAFKDSSYEFFYDAGNTGTSPLQRADAYVGNVGLKIPDSIQTIKDQLFFAGGSVTANPQILKLTEYGIETISTQEIERVLLGYYQQYSNGGTARFRAGTLSFNGKDYYLLEAKGTDSTIFVYDMEEKVWAYWTAFNNDFVIYNQDGDTTNNSLYLIDPSGNFYTLDSSTLDKDSSGVYHQIVAGLSFPKTDFGDTNRKFMNEITISGVMHQGDQFVVTMNSITPRPQTITRTYNNPNNLNLRNYGMFIVNALSLQYYPEPTTPQSALDIQMRGFNMEITLGN